MNYSELQELANYYGYDLQDMTNQPPYNQRKGKTVGICDRRTGLVIATYAKSNPKLKQFFERFSSSKLEAKRRERINNPQKD